MSDENEFKEFWIIPNSVMGYDTIDPKITGCSLPSIHVVDIRALDIWKNHFNEMSEIANRNKDNCIAARKRAESLKSALLQLINWAERTHPMPSYSEIIDRCIELVRQDDEEIKS